MSHALQLYKVEVRNVVIIASMVRSTGPSPQRDSPVSKEWAPRIFSTSTANLIPQSVKEAATRFRTLRHAESFKFQMIIGGVVPARTLEMDYLHHPECDASKVADMICAGK